MRHLSAPSSETIASVAAMLGWFADALNTGFGHICSFRDITILRQAFLRVPVCNSFYAFRGVWLVSTYGKRIVSCGEYWEAMEESVEAMPDEAVIADDDVYDDSNLLFTANGWVSVPDIDMELIEHPIALLDMLRKEVESTWAMYRIPSEGTIELYPKVGES